MALTAVAATAGASAGGAEDDAPGEVALPQDAAASLPPPPPQSPLSRFKWYRKAFAWTMEHLMPAYEERIGERKAVLFREYFQRWHHDNDDDAAAAPTIVEIGAGTGPNFRFYPRGATVIVVEPNEYMQAYLRNKADKHGLNLRFRVGHAETLSQALGMHSDTAGHADFVVSTLVLCSVAEPPRVIDQILRVLRPGGTFVFIEHVGADSRRDRWRRRLQNALTPMQRVLADGCHLNRDTADAVRAAGGRWRDVRIDEFMLGADAKGDTTTAMSLLAPHIAGAAVKR